ncbi:MAG: DegV family protein [Acidimicrobiales bacterium]
MGAIRVVTDSASDLDASVARDQGVDIVGLDVRLGDIGPDVTRTWSPEEFWQNCASSPSLPETSAPSPGAFAEAFGRAADDGADGVVCITLSSVLSATYQSACAGAAEVADRIPVRVVDSLSVTMGEGLTVLEAAQLAASGADLDTVSAALDALKGRVHVYGTLDTLDNLKKGGRIGGAQAFVGSLLSIKPVVVVQDGKVEPESKQRTRSRSLEYLASKLNNAGELERVAVVHAEAPDVGTLVNLIARDFDRDKILVSYVGPVIGTHCGPRTIGLCYIVK